MSESGASGIKIPPSFVLAILNQCGLGLTKRAAAWLCSACFHGRADYRRQAAYFALSPDALTLHPADLETADKTSSLVAFLIEHMRGRGGFLDHRSILLGHLIHLVQRRVDLMKHGEI